MHELLTWSCLEIAGQNHRVRIDNSIFERVEEFKYLGTNLTFSKFYSGRNKE